MPSPREIALQTNDPAKFGTAEIEGYDADAGTPPGVAPQGKQKDYAANPTNPPEPAAPARNLKR